ncbi:ABC transporter permease [uncultured Maribacter sp.]|uniref:ABC transporter permease n=1 Tax=uncultured Maribacter sp. TaxID=431308 RepID=UPI002616B574|nr:ABC transporter permease [uncultured Maribacter sp.]
MNSQVLKTVLRSLGGKKFLSLTKVLGLIVGYAVFLFLAEKIQFEESYDTFWGSAENIYRVALDVTNKEGEELKSAKNFSGSSALLDAEIHGVVSHVNFGKDIVTVFNGPDQKIQDVDFAWSDPSFFEVFDRKILKSESKELLENIHGVTISQSFAKKLFGDENPLGKEISVNEGWTYVVDAVFEDIPAKSHIKIDMIGSYKTLFYYMQNFDNRAQVLIDNPDYEFNQPTPYETRRWGAPVEYRPYCYVKLKKGTSIASIKAMVTPLLKKVALPQNLKDSNINFLFQPVADIHLKSKLEHEISANGNEKQLLFLYIIIAVVLIVCIINFINLNTISAIESLKGFTIRVLNGSKHAQIFQIMLMESFVFNFFALAIAIPLAHGLVVSQLGLSQIGNSSLFIVLAIAGGITVLAAAIPFVSIVKNRIFGALKGGSNSIRQKWTGQKVTVTLQFVITIVLIVSTLGIYKQMNFMMDKELGFNGNKTIYSFTPMTMNQHPDIPNKLRTFKNEVLALSGVNSFSVSSSIPGKMPHRESNQVKEINSAEPYATSFNQISVDEGYINTYDIKLLAGSNLKNQSKWNSDEVLINKIAMEKMGYKDPNKAIGKVIVIGNKNYAIQGVMENYHHVSLHNTVQPTIYMQNLQWDHGVGYYSMQLTSNNITEITSQIAAIWENLYPKEEFIFNFSDSTFEKQYGRDQKFNKTLSVSTFLALLISCLGLLGVALFNTKKRIKEIGVRKVNGAKINEIIVMLNRDFIKWVVIAYIVACPISWYAIDKWLENFAYKTSISWWIYALAGVVAITIALLTVSWQSFKAAKNNPVNALRNE